MLSYLAAALLLQAPQAAPLQRGSRVDKNGWIYITVQGKPRDVGYQHATLLATELDDALKAMKVSTREETGKDWNWYRDAAYELYWNKLDPEYQNEMLGMAEGAKDKGVPIDIRDILAMNAHIELGGYYLPWLRANGKTAHIISKAPMACSAFVATGSYTVDKKVVMGHNLWWSYFLGARWRVIENVKPASGHQFVMDTMPGLIHSATDWAQNSKGILISETTISGFVGYDPKGIPEFQRMRKATQYSSSLDDVVRIFKTGNNGGYANTWLLADTKTGEIGKLQLGLHNVVFERTKDGAYYGANYPEDPKLMQEEAPMYNPEPEGNTCELRRRRWAQVLQQNRGRVDAEMAKRFLSDTYNVESGANDGGGSALCGIGFPVHGAVNAKVTTTDMAARMSLWARMGITDGTSYPREQAIRAFGITGEKAALWPDFTAQPWTLFGKQ